jgi:hypothetical protein
MTPGYLQLGLYRGDTYRWTIKLWVDPNKTQPADLSGVTAKAEIRERPAGTNITVMPCTVTQPNIIDMVLSSDACRALPARGVWDLQLTYASGDVATVIAGPVVLTDDVTDSTLVARSLQRVA